MSKNEKKAYIVFLINDNSPGETLLTTAIWYSFASGFLLHHQVPWNCLHSPGKAFARCGEPLFPWI